MYEKKTLQFVNNIKLDVYRQFHTNAAGRNVVSLEGIDVYLFAWMKLIGISSSIYNCKAENKVVSYEAQLHENTGKQKPRSHIVVASAALGVLLARHVDHMRHKSRSLS